MHKSDSTCALTPYLNLPGKLLACLCLAVICSAGHAADWTLDQLLSNLSQVKSAKANFVEKKYISTLNAPIESSGEMLYTAPDRLEKRTLKPKPELMLLDGDTLTLERGRKKYTMQLGDSPELAALIESVRGTLAGDRRALENNYVVALQGTQASWTLQLTPTDSRALQQVKRIRLRGTNDAILEIEVLQADGDRSVTTIEKTKP
jgi:outer membrane lipoprotein-sorting protein